MFRIVAREPLDLPWQRERLLAAALKGKCVYME